MTQQHENNADWAIWATEGVPAEYRGRVTCEADRGYGPCGTYRDWADGRCSEGHPISIED